MIAKAHQFRTRRLLLAVPLMFLGVVACGILTQSGLDSVQYPKMDLGRWWIALSTPVFGFAAASLHYGTDFLKRRWFVLLVYYGAVFGLVCLMRTGGPFDLLVLAFAMLMVYLVAPVLALFFLFDKPPSTHRSARQVFGTADGAG